MLRNVIFMCLILLVSLPCFAQENEMVFDKILVKINEGIITQYDLEEEMKPIFSKIGDRELNAAEKEQLSKMRKQILERMVNDKLMAQEIEKYGINVSEDRIDLEVERLKKERGFTDDDFLEMLKKDRLTLVEFRNKLKDIIQKQELLGYMVHDKVVVTDSEIQADYEQNSDNYVLDKTVSLAIIILPSEVAPAEVRKRIQDGELTFAEAAEKYTVGPGKDSGGAIGEVAWSDLADEWRDAIDGLKPGEVSAPLVVQEKESLLSIVKINEDQLVPLEDVRDAIFSRLMDEKRETIFEEYFEKLKQSSVIVYMD